MLSGMHDLRNDPCSLSLGQFVPSTGRAGNAGTLVDLEEPLNTINYHEKELTQDKKQNTYSINLPLGNGLMVTGIRELASWSDRELSTCSTKWYNGYLTFLVIFSILLETLLSIFTSCG